MTRARTSCLPRTRLHGVSVSGDIGREELGLQIYKGAHNPSTPAEPKVGAVTFAQIKDIASSRRRGHNHQHERRPSTLAYDAARNHSNTKVSNMEDSTRNTDSPNTVSLCISGAPRAPWPPLMGILTVKKIHKADFSGAKASSPPALVPHTHLGESSGLGRAGSFHAHCESVFRAISTTMTSPRSRDTQRRAPPSTIPQFPPSITKH